MYKLIAFALVAAVTCNDLIQGPEVGKKIYDEKIEASPAIWKQKNEVTIKANDTDIISRIVITDQRPDKDGEVKIIEGGQGQKNVTVELKSPTILRGYNFHIEVYAVEDGLNYPEELYPGEVTEQMAVMENDTQVNLTKEDTLKQTEDSVTETTEDKVETPVMTDRQSRKVDVTVDPTEQSMSEDITEASKTVTHTSMPHKSHSLLLPTSQEDMMRNRMINEDKMGHTITPSHDAINPRPLKEELHGLKTNINRN